MRHLLLALIATAAVAASVPALAQRQSADDTKWITACVSDNKDEGQSAPVVLKYCTCMNNKMSDNETQSITQWEKSHPTERQACDKAAGWR
jgi:hypothetical protein